MTQTTRPRFTGVRIYNDPDRLFSFFYPHTWHLTQPDGSKNAVIVTPDANSIATSFSVEVRDLGTAISSNDLPVLRDAVEEGLRQLGEIEIETFREFEAVDRVGFELRYTFKFDSTWRKRHTLLYYHDHYQYSLISQGATIEVFDYWRSMLSYIMFTCKAGAFDLRAWLEDQKPVE